MLAAENADSLVIFSGFLEQKFSRPTLCVDLLFVTPHGTSFKTERNHTPFRFQRQVKVLRSS